MTQPTDPFEVHLEAQLETDSSDVTAIDRLAAACELSRQQVKQALSNGAVWLQTSHGIQRIRRGRKQLNAGDQLHLYYNADVQRQTPPAARLIDDQGEYSVWFKPPGMYSQGSKWGDHCTLYRWAETHLQPERKAWLVHRLDRAASGLMLLAHNKKTAGALASMFSHSDIEKHYRVIVEGDATTLQLPFEIEQPLDDKQARTTILDAQYQADSNSTILRLRIHTGRKHQIRRHLSELGYPVLGDRLYGSGNSNCDLMLSAVYLAFDCPLSGERRTYELD